MWSLFLGTCLLLQAFSVQTDWTGGPGMVGPVDSFGTAFHSSDSIAYGSSGLIVPTTKMTGQGIITSWTEHVVEDNDNIDGHNAIRPADFDGDGDYDLAGVIEGLDIVRIYRNRLIENGGDQVTFTQQVDVATDISKYCLTWVGDLDDDGRPDIVVPGDNMYWLKNNGNWSFTRIHIGYWNHRGDTNFCDVGDVDNDGDLDIVNGMRPVLLWRNNGDMTFTPESIAEGRRYRAKLGDLNGDGYLDLLQTDQVYLNLGAANPGVFAWAWGSGFNGGQSDGSWIADFDGDNDRDILVCREWVWPRSLCAIIWYENDGSGMDYIRHDIETGPTAFEYADAAIAEDMDLDGRPDVVGGYQQIGYFHQEESGGFTEVVVDPDFYGPGGCHWVEVENLGKQPGGLKFTKDIVAATGHMFHWWENGLDTSYSMNGQLVSSILDATGPADWEWFVWDASRPESTYLDFFVRTGATAAQCTLNPWQGPIPVAIGVDNDSADIGPYTTSGNRYFQYRVTMAGDSSGVLHRAPVVYEVKVVYNSDQAVHDVGVTVIIEPSDTLGTGRVVSPRAVVRNYGTVEEAFPVTFQVEGGYDETVPDVTVGAGETDTVDFPPWTAGPLGVLQLMSFTSLPGDENRSNDTAYGEVTVTAPRHDVGARGILVPAGKVLLNGVVWPTIRVENYGDFTETFDVEVEIRDAFQQTLFLESEEVAALEAGETTVLAFTEHSWTASEVGSYTVTATAKLAGDDNPGNDAVGPEHFLIVDAPPGPPGWAEMDSMPSAPSGKAVKRGGWLAIDPETRLLYAMKGYKTYDFYSYDVWSGEWTQLAKVPPSGPGHRKQKPPGKGSKGICDGNGGLYMTKGYNTRQFWKYEIPEDTWHMLPDVPAGPRRKRVKGGTDMVFVVRDDTGYVYLMKGHKTEFYRFNTETSRWESLPNLPYGQKEKWNKGSFLVYDGENTIYAHQARYYDKTAGHHYMFTYDLGGDTWSSTPHRGMPVLGMHSGRLRKKKCKDGASGDWFADEIYALKGGNSQQFWQCTPMADSWVELDTMPSMGTTGRRRMVKYGADLVHYGSGVFFALKGNKTREMWRYKVGISVGPSPERRGAVMAGGSVGPPAGVSLSLDPLVDGFARVSYVLPRPGPVSFSVCDLVGREVAGFEMFGDRTGTASLDLRDLARGVYLVRLESRNLSIARRLIVH